MSSNWSLRRGATLQADGSTRFAVWAPASESLRVRIHGGDPSLPLFLRIHTTERLIGVGVSGIRSPGFAWRWALRHQVDGVARIDRVNEYEILLRMARRAVPLDTSLNARAEMHIFLGERHIRIFDRRHGRLDERRDRRHANGERLRGWYTGRAIFPRKRAGGLRRRGRGDLALRPRR